MLDIIPEKSLIKVAGGNPTVEIYGGGNSTAAGGVVKVSVEVVPGTTVAVTTGGNTVQGFTIGTIHIATKIF